jgi:pimeloyl-ACP methyl ester carboxylesterase
MLCSWKVPTMVAWGESDKHLPKSEAENFVKTNPDIIKSVMLAGAGHLPQEDW